MNEQRIAGLDCLIRMATTLGMPAEAARWETIKNQEQGAS